ncbi:MAG TPA: hypothetical protein VLA71_19910 [Algoriphagus sp.]|nr:hypothetical protein [Algoriphagus sp.]
MEHGFLEYLEQVHIVLLNNGNRVQGICSINTLYAPFSRDPLFRFSPEYYPLNLLKTSF